MAITDNLTGAFGFGEMGGHRYNTITPTLSAALGNGETLDGVAGNPLGGLVVSTSGSGNQFLTHETPPSSYFLGGGQFCVGVLVKFSSLASSSGICGQWLAGNNNRCWRFRYSSSGLRISFILSTNGTDQVIATANAFGAPSTGVWYLIFGGWDGTNAWIQINNGTVNSIASAAPVSSSTAPFRVGEVDGEWTTGAFARLFFWKGRTPSSGERSSLWNSGNFADPLPLYTSKTLWETSFATGDLSELTRNNGRGTGGSEQLSGVASTADAVLPTWTGTHSRLLTITTPNSPSSGARLFRNVELQQTPNGCYLGCMYYLPTLLTPDGAGDYVDLMQLKSHGASSNPVWWVSISNRGDGSMYLRLCEDNASGFVAWHEQTLLNLPLAQWFSLEFYVVQSSTGTGRIVVWQDGTILFDFSNVTTLFSGSDLQEWSVNLYSDSVLPHGQIHSYVGKMAVSKTRIFSGSTWKSLPWR